MFLWMNVCLFKNVKASKTDEIGACAKKVFNQILKCWKKTFCRPGWCSEYLGTIMLPIRPNIGPKILPFLNDTKIICFGGKLTKQFRVAIEL